MGGFVEVKSRTKTRVTYHQPDTVNTEHVYLGCAATYKNFGFSKPPITKNNVFKKFQRHQMTYFESLIVLGGGPWGRAKRKSGSSFPVGSGAKSQSKNSF